MIATGKPYGYEDESARRDLCEYQYATLDGKPACICGALRPFATVRHTEAPFFGVEFAWQTVARIVNDKAGEFRT